MDSFIGDFSHEFKNPLSVVRTAAEILPEADETEKSRFIHLIDQNTKRMEMILDGIRDFALINRELEEKDAEPVDAVSLLEDIIEGFKIMFPDKRWIFEQKTDLSIICFERVHKPNFYKYYGERVIIYALRW